MATRNIQNFLMVSAAFFAMTGPVRSQGAGALATAGMQMRRIMDAALAPAGVAAATQVVSAPTR